MAETVIIDWKLIGGAVVTLLTFGCTWAYTLWYKYLIENEDKIVKKTETEIDSVVGKSRDLRKKIGVQKLARRLLNYSKLRERVESGKHFFEKNMIFSGGATLLLGLFFALLSQNQDALLKYQSFVLMALAMAVIFFCGAFYDLFVRKSEAERFLKGIHVDEIYKEEDKNEN